MEAKLALQVISAVILTPAYRGFPGSYRISTERLDKLTHSNPIVHLISIPSYYAIRASYYS